MSQELAAPGGKLPHDFPSWKTVYWYFTRWNNNGTLDHLHNALREKVRVAEGRNPEPAAGIVDAQSIRGEDTGGKDSRGYDVGKEINGRKRNIVVDTSGMLLILLSLPRMCRTATAATE